MAPKVQSFHSLKTAHAFNLCMERSPGLDHRPKVYQGSLSQIRFCMEHQRVCAKCERVFALNDEKSGWIEHIAEYVILIGLADVLFTDHHYRVHDGVDPNTTSQVRYLLLACFQKHLPQKFTSRCLGHCWSCNIGKVEFHLLLASIRCTIQEYRSEFGLTPHRGYDNLRL